MVLPRRSALVALLLAATATGARPAASEPEKPAAPVARLHGILRGVVVRLEPFFRWTADERVQWGVLGRAHGTTPEFEDIDLEIGGDRSVLTAAVRAGYEAYRIRRVVARGEAAQVEVKPDGAVVRLTNPFKDAVYACAVKQVGRTAVFVRGTATKKQEAGLVRLVRATAAGAVSETDDVDGWLPAEVKAKWTRTPSSDLLVVDDGTLDDARKQEIVKVVRDAYAVAKRAISGGFSTSFPPVLRLTKKRDMLGFLSGRRDLAAVDAAYIPWAGELMVSPREGELDAAQVAQEAAAQAVHYLLGSYDAEPLLTGIRRQAAAIASGAPPGSLLHSDEARAFERVRAHQATSWYRLMMMSTLANFLSEDALDRSVDAEMALGYLTSPSAPVGKASLAAWVTAFRKVGHPDAASEAAVGAMEGTKSDAEYWAYWTAKADPPKKPEKPGKPGK